MRTPTNNPVGTAAQSVVKAQFELLGWGVAPNPEHDLGTDHWVMARDDERVDIRRLVGVQVKAGTTPFKRKVTVDGVVTGWWYYERDDRHFEYWSSHSIPHILALHEIKDGSTYWVHVTADKILSTGKGRKIFVPSPQTIDAANRGALMDVALSSSTLPEFQGSAWEEGEDVPPESALRYALLTPRLLAPHGNRTPTAISPAQAIALLVQMRITTLERWQKIEPLLDHRKAAESTAWGWRFYSALWGALLEGNLDPIGVIYIEAPDAPSRAAAIAALVAIRFEEEAVPRALGEINALDQTGFSAVDRAWIEAHRARLLVETGDTGGAQASAITVAPIGRIALGDPTAAMLSGSAAELIFNLSDWDGESLACHQGSRQHRILVAIADLGLGTRCSSRGVLQGLVQGPVCDVGCGRSSMAVHAVGHGHIGTRGRHAVLAERGIATRPPPAHDNGRRGPTRQRTGPGSHLRLRQGGQGDGEEGG